MQQKQNKKHRRNAGFTLIEIMVVVLIIGMLATLVGPNVMRALGKSNVTKCKADISALQQAVKMYKMDNRRFPDSLDILAEADDSGESYIEGNVMPLDPWGNEYFYNPQSGGQPMEIGSYGADMSPGGEGEDADITNLTIREVN